METIKTIIDTDLLIDLLRNQRQTTTFITSLEEKNYALTTTTINVFELYQGAHKSKATEKNLQAIKTLTNRLTILPLTTKSAQKAGYIYSQLESQGQPIGLRDTFIASIALTSRCSLATRNQQHFNRISGLKIITP